MDSDTSKTPPNLLTVKQVAEILQWNPFTVTKKAEKGELPGFKLGREWRFSQADIIRWIDEKKSHGQGGAA